MTYLCVPIFVIGLAEARKDASLAVAADADMVEYRIDIPDDRFTDEVITELVRTSPLPCIVTCRPTWEGGRSTFDNKTRFASLKAAARACATYVDVELEAYRKSGRDLTVDGRLILSSHDFQGRPARLYALMEEMNAAPCNVCKIVWTARSIRDCVEAFELLNNRTKPTIALCMGEAGVATRILAKKFGGFLTFASLDTSSGTAPGQVTIQQMKQLYRWDAITPKTRVYGVVASPVKHSMSPAIHNAAFEAVGHNGVYLPFLVEPGYESFKAFMETFLAFKPLHLSGLSITLPHKENALRYLKEKNAVIEPLAEKIGAVNTIVMTDPESEISNSESQIPHLSGCNSDYAAILDSITSALGITRDALAGKSAGIIGAGGTGRTAVAALAHYGVNVTIYNRTPERGAELAREFGATSRALSEVATSAHDLYLNTTSVGMHPKVDESPFDGNLPALGPRTLVFDAVYNPPQTKLLTQARDAGALTVSGVEMFVRQAVRQFELWTGTPAPADLMRAVVFSRLK